MTYPIRMASVAALVAASPALAQTATETTEGAGEVVVLDQWSYDPLYAEGWSVDEMFDDTDVIDASGEEIGDVENLIFADDGTLLAVIAQIGGFWDIGDTHVSIPWAQVTLSADGETLTVPVTEETIEDYAGFDGTNAFNWDDEELFAASDADAAQVVSDDLAAGPMVFKATDLMNDLTYLNDDVRYGYVSDILVSGDGISAILVDAAGYGTPGNYAYPYYGYRGYSPYGTRYDLPYDREEITTIERFDYDRFSERSE
jgi:hypothetical protein